MAGVFCDALCLSETQRGVNVLYYRKWCAGDPHHSLQGLPVLCSVTAIPVCDIKFGDPEEHEATDPLNTNNSKTKMNFNLFNIYIDTYRHI